VVPFRRDVVKTAEDIELAVDKEFRSLIPASSKEQLADLKKAIDREGKFLDPIRYWNDGQKNLILDGHQRWEIWCKLPADTCIPPPKVEERLFPDRRAAEVWMLFNQLGRRNLLPTTESILRGRLYNSLKKPVGRPSAEKLCHSDIISEAAEKVAEETHSSTRTVTRDGAFAEALDVIGSVNGKAKADIETGTLKVPKKDVIAIGRLPKPEIAAAIKHVRAGEAWKSNGEVEQKPKRGKKAVSPRKFSDRLKVKLVSPLVKGIDKLAEMNGGKGKFHSQANEALNELLVALREMGGGKP